MNKCRCAADKRTPETNEWNERSRNLIVMRKATTKSLPRGVKRMPLNRLASRFISHAAAAAFSFIAVRCHYLLSRYKLFIQLSTPLIISRRYFLSQSFCAVKRHFKHYFRFVGFCLKIIAYLSAFQDRLRLT